MGKSKDFINKHKVKIIAGAIVFAGLLAAWFFGGNYPGGGGKAQETELPAVPEASRQLGSMSADDSFTVTLAVRCSTLLENMGMLDKEKHELVPEGGVIYPESAVTAFEGESVFNVLQRTMKQAEIHMAFRNTPVYGSAYIEAINNLYEFDAGDLSGWMYSVNGRYPSYGCSRHLLAAGDAIVWDYTCDLGRDLGQAWLTGGQIDE